MSEKNVPLIRQPVRIRWGRLIAVIVVSLVVSNIVALVVGGEMGISFGGITFNICQLLAVAFLSKAFGAPGENKNYLGSENE